MEQGNAVNFHGHIAWPLETMAKRLLTKEDFSADAIETGNFVAVMALILTKMGKPEEAAALLRECGAYLGQPASKIPMDAAMEIYQKFVSLIGEGEDD